MLANIAANFLFGLAVDGLHRREPPNRALLRLTMAAMVLFNIGVLAFFKYFNFVMDNVNALLTASGRPAVEYARVALPHRHLVLHLPRDVLRDRRLPPRDAGAAGTPLDFALYISLFPQLVAGPIVRYHDVAAQLTRRIVDLASFAGGIRRFAVGLAKKVLIANTCGAVGRPGLRASRRRSSPPGSPGWAPSATRCQIYFDFSGYSDMAIGLGRMFGFEFLENFNYPYVARSIQRVLAALAHLALDLVPRLPVHPARRQPRARPGAPTSTSCWSSSSAASGTARAGRSSPGGSTTALSSCWSASALRPCGRRALARRCATPTRSPWCSSGWVLFRADSFAQAVAHLGAMAGVSAASGSEYSVGMFLDRGVTLALAAAAIGSAPVVPWVARKVAVAAEGAPSVRARVVSSLAAAFSVTAVALLLFFSAMLLATDTYNPFIYYRF